MTHEGDGNAAVDHCAHCEASNAMELNRRSFFASLLGMGTVAIGAIVGLPLFRFVLYPVYASSGSGEWSDVGEANEFQHAEAPIVKTISLTQRDGWRDVVSHQSVYVTRSPEGSLQVLSAVCPHLGCSVNWNASQGRFICPCHGGQFKADGRHISGPPPRGLDKLKAQVKDGKLQVRFENFRSNVPDQQLLS